MKAIINGLRYDTETATLIGSASNPNTPKVPTQWSPSRHWEESLYRTEGGRYFLVGLGGTNTKWDGTGVFRGDDGAICRRNVIGEGIEALTREAAQAWAERWLRQDVYEAAFKDVIADA